MKLTRSLNCISATIILVGYLAAQFCCALVIAVIAVVIALGQQTQHPEEIIRILKQLQPLTLTLSPVVGGIAVVCASLRLVPGSVKDVSPNGAAWVRGQWMAVARGLAIGVVIGAVTSFMNTLFYRPHYGEIEGVARMASTPGALQILWVVIAVLLAPASEEILFRGVLFGGFRRSFGTAWAVVVTTLLFLLGHFSQLLHYPLAAFSISCMALSALWCRLRAGAIGPAIAVHTGTNLTFCVLVIGRTWIR